MRSKCAINVEWFPFDEQTCSLKFGSWSHTEESLNLLHMDGNRAEFALEYQPDTGTLVNISVVKNGIDLEYYYPSVEWDLIEVTARRHRKMYPGCCSTIYAYIDITFTLVLRRKPLFYVVNLILPCIGISILSVIMLYLPIDCGKRMHFSINVLVALTVFYMLLVEITPATSEVLPLVGKYLLFILITISSSVLHTVITTNLQLRSITDYQMPDWIKQIFLKILPKYLLMQRPVDRGEDMDEILEMSKMARKGRRRIILYKKRFPTKFDSSGEASDEVDEELASMADDEGSIYQKVEGAKISALNSVLFLDDDQIRRNKEVLTILNSDLAKQAFRNICCIAAIIKQQRRDKQVNDYSMNRAMFSVTSSRLLTNN
uniref:Uncharacterized protein n=1 Tax=Romanomermis culicivorax TaxID=13658 RepID=A0A915K114_ROMCU